MSTAATAGTAKFSPPALSNYNNVPAAFNGITQGDPYTLPTLPSVALGFGTGAGQFNLASKLYTGTATAATVLVDLTTLLDDKGNTVNLARCKGLVVLNFNTAGKILKAGNAGSNPWAAPFGASTHILNVPPGYADAGSNKIPGMVVLCAPDATGLAVSGTSKVLMLDPGAETIPYGYFLIGVDA